MAVVFNYGLMRILGHPDLFILLGGDSESFTVAAPAGNGSAEPELGLMTIAEGVRSVTLPENRNGIISPSFRPLTHCGAISGHPAPRHLSRSVPADPCALPGLQC